MKKTHYSLLFLLLVSSVGAQARTYSIRPSLASRDSRAWKRPAETIGMQFGRKAHLYYDLTYDVATSVASPSTVNKSGEAGDAIDRYSHVVDIISSSIGAMIYVKRHLAQEENISAAEELNLTKLMLTLNTASKAFSKKLQGTSKIDASNQAEVLKVLSGVESAVSDLNKSGVLKVGNEDAREELSAFITIMEAAIALSH